MLGTGIGSALRSRAPLAMMFTVLGIATLVTTACAVFFGLWSVLVVALVAAVSQTLVKVALDSILQREIPAETRSSTFAFSETLHQLALVGGGLIGLLLSLTGSGFAGLTVAAIGLALALCWLTLTRRAADHAGPAGLAGPGRGKTRVRIPGRQRRRAARRRSSSRRGCPGAWTGDRYWTRRQAA